MSSSVEQAIRAYDVIRGIDPELETGAEIAAKTKETAAILPLHALEEMLVVLQARRARLLVRAMDPGGRRYRRMVADTDVCLAVFQDAASDARFAAAAV